MTNATQIRQATRVNHTASQQLLRKWLSRYIKPQNAYYDDTFQFEYGDNF